MTLNIELVSWWEIQKKRKKYKENKIASSIINRSGFEPSIFKQLDYCKFHFIESYADF